MAHKGTPGPDGLTKTHYKIGEVSEMLGVKPYVLRYWESEFEALSPKKSSGRHRLYSPDDIQLLRTIKGLLHERMLSIKGARQHLNAMRAGLGDPVAPRAPDGGPLNPPSADVFNAVLGDAERDALEQQLQQLRAENAQLREQLTEAQQAATLANDALKSVQRQHDDAQAQLAQAKRDLERDTLAEAEAQSQIARAEARARAVEADLAKLRDDLQRVEQRADRAEQRAADAEQRAADAEQRAADAEQRAEAPAQDPTPAPDASASDDADADASPIERAAASVSAMTQAERERFERRIQALRDDLAAITQERRTLMRERDNLRRDLRSAQKAAAEAKEAADANAVDQAWMDDDLIRSKQQQQQARHELNDRLIRHRLFLKRLRGELETLGEVVHKAQQHNA